ncbi:MAG: tyrosine-type recombinase/integrase [Gaiellaceae bacterium]
MQGNRTRALDSRGRPVPGLYVRDGRFIAGYQCPQTHRWRMQTLDADSLTDARRERDSLLAALREERESAPSTTTFADVFAEFQTSRRRSDRTHAHEQHLVRRHLAALSGRRAQDITPTDVARLLRRMSEQYSPWTCVAIHRILRGSFALAVRRRILTRSPMDGLAPSELPRQRNARKVLVLDDQALAQLVAAGASERVRAALGLASYAGLRLGEVRALAWRDVDLAAGTITVRRSALPDGTLKAPKTGAGNRTVPLLPALRRLLVEWKLRSPRARPDDLIACTVGGRPMEERNLRRALDDAKQRAHLDGGEDRLSWHSLRHSFASMLATDLELPATTLARLTGHADAGFTLKVYARDSRDEQVMVDDVLARAQAARVGA